MVPDHLKQDKEPAIIKNCINSGVDFVDTDFPPNQITLTDPTGRIPSSGWENLKWQRAKEMFGNKPFFVFNGINPQDVK